MKHTNIHRQIKPLIILGLVVIVALVSIILYATQRTLTADTLTDAERARLLEQYGREYLNIYSNQPVPLSTGPTTAKTTITVLTYFAASEDDITNGTAKDYPLNGSTVYLSGSGGTAYGVTGNPPSSGLNPGFFMGRTLLTVKPGDWNINVTNTSYPKILKVETTDPGTSLGNNTFRANYQSPLTVTFYLTCSNSRDCYGPQSASSQEYDYSQIPPNTPRPTPTAAVTATPTPIPPVTCRKVGGCGDDTTNSGTPTPDFTCQKVGGCGDATATPTPNTNNDDRRCLIPLTLGCNSQTGGTEPSGTTGDTSGTGNENGTGTTTGNENGSGSGSETTGTGDTTTGSEPSESPAPKLTITVALAGALPEAEASVTRFEAGNGAPVGLPGNGQAKESYSITLRRNSANSLSGALQVDHKTGMYVAQITSFPGQGSACSISISPPLTTTRNATNIQVVRDTTTKNINFGFSAKLTGDCQRTGGSVPIVGPIANTLLSVVAPSTLQLPPGTPASYTARVVATDTVRTIATTITNPVRALTTVAETLTKNIVTQVRTIMQNFSPTKPNTSELQQIQQQTAATSSSNGQAQVGSAKITVTVNQLNYSGTSMGQPAAGLTVQAIRGGQIVTTGTTDSNGKVVLTVNNNAEYIVQVDPSQGAAISFQPTKVKLGTFGDASARLIIRVFGQ